MWTRCHSYPHTPIRTYDFEVLFACGGTQSVGGESSPGTPISRLALFQPSFSGIPAFGLETQAAPTGQFAPSGSPQESTSLSSSDEESEASAGAGLRTLAP